MQHQLRRTACQIDARGKAAAHQGLFQENPRGIGMRRAKTRLGQTANDELPGLLRIVMEQFLSVRFAPAQENSAV